MLSRVADSIYWLNRYVERAENIARFVDVNLNLLLDAPVGIYQQWEPIVTTTGDLKLFQSRYDQPTAANVIRFLTFDATYSSSILSCLLAARENARSIREVISSEMWEQVNAFYLMVKDAAQLEDLLELPRFFAEVKMASHLFAGVMGATMSHNEGWHFGRVGRLLERADKTARILDVKYFILLPTNGQVSTTLDELQWIALLKSTSGYEMYRKSHHRISPQDVAQFLIFERDFPRSIQFCLIQAEKSLFQITGGIAGRWGNPAERNLGKLRSQIDFMTIEEIMQSGLHEFLDQTEVQINQVGECISQKFFDIQAVA
jgi:uncharacterized alpha-E superfamily protein